MGDTFPVLEVSAPPRPAGSLPMRFASAAWWSLSGAVFARGSVFLASVLCARLLGRVGFGELGIIQSTVGMFGIFAGLGLSLTATKFVAELHQTDPARVGRILALCSLAALISAAILTLVLALASPYLAAHTLAAPQLALPLGLGSGLVFFGALNGAQTGALTGLEAFRMIARINLWTGLSTLILASIGAWYGRVQGAVAGLVAAMAVNWLLNHLALRKESRMQGVSYRFEGCLAEWRVLKDFSLPAFLASIVVGPVMWLCNTMLVNQPAGYAAMGLYAAADKLRLLILFVPTSVATTALPMLTRLRGTGNQSGYRNVLNANLLLNLGLTALPAAGVVLFAIPILSMYGTNFRAAWPILWVLAFSAIPESLNNVWGYAVMTSISVWWRLWFDVLLALVLAAMAMWAIPHWGALGLATAYALAFSITAFGLFLFVRGRSGRSLQVTD